MLLSVYIVKLVLTIKKTQYLSAFAGRNFLGGGNTVFVNVIIGFGVLVVTRGRGGVLLSLDTNDVLTHKFL